MIIDHYLEETAENLMEHLKRIGPFVTVPRGQRFHEVRARFPSHSQCEYCGSVVKDLRCDSCGAPVKWKKQPLPNFTNCY